MMRFAYADPPYYKQGKRLYGDHPEAHMWDAKEGHIDLVNRLVNEYPDGWAMSCNPADLQWLLPACPTDLRVCAWAKTFHQIRPKCSIQYAWEPVLVHNGRKIQNRKPMIRDWMACARSMRKGTIGAKPDAFNRWVLELLGFQPGDTLDDLFPGSGGMSAMVDAYTTELTA